MFLAEAIIIPDAIHISHKIYLAIVNFVNTHLFLHLHTNNYKLQLCHSFNKVFIIFFVKDLQYEVQIASYFKIFTDTRIIFKVLEVNVKFTSRETAQGLSKSSLPQGTGRTKPKSVP